MLSNETTSQPPVRKTSHTWDPRNPQPPVTRTFTPHRLSLRGPAVNLFQGLQPTCNFTRAKLARANLVPRMDADRLLEDGYIESFNGQLGDEFLS